MLKIFLSWSGEPAKECAKLLHKWLPRFNAAIKPFVSSEDIRKGDRGLQRIAEQLEGCSFGIVCVNRSNRDAPWINFESGALSRQVSEGKVIPFLFGATTPRDLVDSPLQQFQAVVAESEGDVLAMVKAINARCEPAADEVAINELFEMIWPRMQAGLQEIAERPAAGKESEAPPPRPAEEILDDLLLLIREQVNRITDLERAVRALSPDNPRRTPFMGLFDDVSVTPAGGVEEAASGGESQLSPLDKERRRER
ncbi:TIR domain-containing protein [Streptomyces sp. NPDC001868]|uniref:TIR domain-containing protein n=1 Tax=Streptomyces sp. NPDC001868 TaxID=3154401 RepID=UPI00331ED892